VLFLKKIPFNKLGLRREPRPLGLSLGTKPERDEGSAERTGFENDIGWLYFYMRKSELMAKAQREMAALTVVPTDSDILQHPPATGRLLFCLVRIKNKAN
jgi:hypothetical protein